MLVTIPAGSFLMGSTERDDERPVHRVRVDAFAIASHQVTNAEYDEFLAATGHLPPPHRFSDPEQPVVAVSWFDAMRYCEWRGVRLPSEAEWEYAARGGWEGKRFPWGDEPIVDPDRWQDGPEPVGRGTPNAFGLHGMCENVHEWCSDWYGPYGVARQGEGTRRVSRGGSWRHHVKTSRCAARSSLAPDLRYADYGFRIAASPPLLPS